MWYLFWFALGLAVYAGIDKLVDLYFSPAYNPYNQLDAAQLVEVIDARMGCGWCKELAEVLKE